MILVQIIWKIRLISKWKIRIFLFQNGGKRFLILFITKNLGCRSCRNEQESLGEIANFGIFSESGFDCHDLG